MKKRGSHLEIVISFIIFSFFLLFLLYFVQILAKAKEDKREILSSAKLGFMEQIGGDLTTFSVEVTTSGPRDKDCIKMTANFKNDLINLLGSEESLNKLVIKDKEDNMLDYGFQGNSMIIAVPEEYTDFLRFYYSENIDSSLVGSPPSPCDNVNDYEISPIRSLEVDSITSIEDTLSLPYDGDNGLKSLLKIPADSEVRFKFEKSDGSTIEGGMPEVPKQANVYTERIHLIYTDTDGIKKVGFLTIMIW